jgi:hypothetical protein
MRKVFLFIASIFLLVLTYACTGSKVVQPSASALFFDDFSNTASGWTRLQNEATISDYAQNYYRMYIKNPGTLLIANPGKSFDGDVSIEVDARKVGGSGVSYTGILCHYQDPDNYYMLMITSDGYSGIAIRKGGQDRMISPPQDFLKRAGIKSGNALNHIRADCVGEALTLYANGKQVALAYNSELTGGDVGLMMRSGKYTDQTDIRFENFIVNKPPQP